MSGMFLPVAIDNAEFVLERALPGLALGALDELDELLQVCAFFRQRGTCSLLHTGSAEGFHVNNMQSAAAFAHRLPQLDEARKVTAWAKPVFDCVASGYWQAARYIAHYSRKQWNPDYEYEDDFLYARFVLEHLILGGPVSEAAAMLDDYERALEGGSDLRLDICRALLERDADELDLGLRALMAARAERAWAQVERGVITHDPATWYPHVSVEGLALLALAGQIGLSTGTHYPQCPEVARAASPFVFDADAWRSLQFRPRRV